MAEQDLKAVQVAVRVRPLNQRERNEGQRRCVEFDEPSKQVVLTAVDKNTLLQLKGNAARGYAFDQRYGQDCSADDVYNGLVKQLVENLFKGYNGTVLAYGQTGSGKTHTMSGGTGIHGIREDGVIPLAIAHIFHIVENLKKKIKPGESVSVRASAMEIYNEDLKSLAPGAEHDQKLKLQERPGRDGRVAPEVVGLQEFQMHNAAEMNDFFARCNQSRSTTATKLNDRSSRSHAIFTITVERTIIEVLDQLDEQMNAKVVTQNAMSKLHLVDLAGSERVKRSGVTGAALKEATHINQGLLALGNVIVALADAAEAAPGAKAAHIPYRSSKLTRLLQDSLGGNSLTALVTCISPAESDFEETNNALKYANRACAIKNTPLANKYVVLEEDLLPMLPKDGPGIGVPSISLLLEDHARQREIHERREREKAEKEAKRQEQLAELKKSKMRAPGYQRLLAQEYDRKLKEARRKGITEFAINSTVEGEKIPITKAHPALSTAPASAHRASPRPGSRSARNPAGSRSRHGPAGASGAGFNFNEFLSSRKPGSPAPDSAAATPAADDDARSDGTVDEPAHAEPMPRAGAEFAEGTSTPESTAGPPAHAHSDTEVPRSSSQDIPDDDAIVRRARREAEAAAAAAAEAEAARELAQKWEKEEAERQAAAAADERIAAERAEADGAEAGEEAEPEPEPEARPKLLARFKVNKFDAISVFKAVTREDFADVVSLLPENTPLPASDKMTYLIARLELVPSQSILERLSEVHRGEKSMNAAVGPAVGCLMATFGTNMISSCIFDFDDPEALELFNVDERIELWGLQIPHNSVRPGLEELQIDPDATEAEIAATQAQAEKEATITWTSIDRLNMSVGLLHALCLHANELLVRCGFCVPRPQLLRRWQQAGVKMRQVETEMRLIYPSHAHDYEYYKSSTVAFFLVDEVTEYLARVLSLLEIE